MDIYDYDEIKEAADCVEYCKRELGMSPTGTSGNFMQFHNPWRAGSDSGAFSVAKTGFTDHVSGEKGSIIDLVANAQFGGDLFGAQDHLGRYFDLTPKMPVKDGRKIVKVYQYKDLEGNVCHETVRWDPKDFSQRRPDPDNEDKFIWSIKGVDTILYNLAAWHEKKGICVVGGEKDVENLTVIGIPATTNPMGEGNWKAAYNEWFRGKKVYILPDNDDAGQAHAQNVAWNVRNIAEEVKIVQLPDLPPTGDVTDWIEAGGDKSALIALIDEVPALNTDELQQPDYRQEDESVAAQANAKPFRNYEYETFIDSQGNEKDRKVPRKLREMVKDVHRRFWDFPRLVGHTLFDHDRKSGRIVNIESASKLKAWMDERSPNNSEISGKPDGCTTREELYHALHDRAQHYEMISGVPSWPSRNDVYYTHGPLPEPSEDRRYFDEFFKFFEGASGVDQLLIKLLIASPLYYRPLVDRPMWVIDSDDGQGSGKTKLVEMVAYLYGGDDIGCRDPLTIDYKEMNNEMAFDRNVRRRLLSPQGRRKRICLIDNVDGFYHCSQLAQLITAGAISGMAQYGRGDETRPNDLSYMMTSNSATLDRDLIDRSMILKLQKPSRRVREWEKTVSDYIAAHRLRIIADIKAVLESGPQFELETPQSRFGGWEREVMAPILGNMANYSAVWKEMQARRASADGEVEESETVTHALEQGMRDIGVDPDTYCVWITSPVLQTWCLKAIPGFGGAQGRGATQKLKRMAGKMIPQLAAKPQKYPHSGKRSRRGMLWNPELYPKAHEEGDVRFVFKIDENRIEWERSSQLVEGGA